MQEIIIEFLIIFTVVYIAYFISVVIRTKLKNDKDPTELIYLKNRFKLDFNKINKQNVIWTVALANSLIITIVYLVIQFTTTWFYKIIITFLAVLFSINIFYTIIGKHYYNKQNKTK